ncbi:MAG TPA: CHAT domain-containing tetratricopeptide repeat protein, partial [Alphaproteobacteria bacterium]|nr:CHAT domain-containing tetratricopeptide repeat protein [Alphaproteobacteria bacterium]
MREGRVRRLVAAVLAALALSGCAAAPEMTDAGATGSRALPLAVNLVGESCRAQPDFGGRVENVWRAYEVFCGRWEEPSARVYEVPATSAEQMLAADYADASWWRSALDNRMDCRPGRSTTILDGVPATVLDCTLRNGGWPYVAVAAGLGGSIYLADGIPAAFPSVESAIGALSGRATFTGASGESGTRSAAVRQLEALLAGRLYGGGDLEDYNRLLRIAQYYNGLKNFAEAEKYYREALEIHQRLLPDDSPGRGDVLMHLALELSNQERFNEADVLFARAEDMLRGGDDPTDYPRLVSYLALNAANQRNYEEGLMLARRATSLRQDLADEVEPHRQRGPVGQSGIVSIGLIAIEEQPDLAGLGAIVNADIAQSLYIEAAMLRLMDRLDEARRTMAEAEAILRRTTSSPDWWEPQFNLQEAEILAAQEDYAGAESILRDVIDQQRRLFTNSRLEGLAYLALGRVHRSQGRDGEALGAFRAAIPIIQAQGGGLGFEEILPYLETLMEDADREPERRTELFAEMFEVGQLVRGTITSQTIAIAAARLSSSDEEVGSVIRALQDEQRRRNQLNEDLTRAQADGETPPEEVVRLQADLAASTEKIRALELQVQAASPGYNQLVDAPTTAERVIGLLQPDEALVQILLGEAKSFVFMVRHDGIRAYPVDMTKELAGRIVDHLRIPFDEARYLPEFDVETSHMLYRALFGPIHDDLSSVEHLITVPTGPLLSLPLGVLVTEPSPRISDYNYLDVSWLAARSALTLAPSVRSFVDLRGLVAPSPAPNPFIGFGDFRPVGDADLIVQGRQLPDSCLGDAGAVAQAPRLPETADEVRRVGAILDAGSNAEVLGAAFSEETLRTRPLDQYRVVYFATHGLLPGELDCWAEPSLLVSRPADAAEGDDGLLQTSEIIELDLNAELVVLSACNTGGAGAGTGGESLTGLARAFFYAGARSLLVSHWVVESQPTTELMIGMFRALASG